VHDFALIPREYLLVNCQRIEKALKAGVDIPGIKVDET
jgi:hypothetical protein